MSSTSVLRVVVGFEPDEPDEPDEPEEPDEPDEPEPDGCVAGWIVGSTSEGCDVGRVVLIVGAVGLTAAKAVKVSEKMSAQARTAAITFFIGKHQTFH